MKSIVLWAFFALAQSISYAQQVAPIYFYNNIPTADRRMANSYAIYGKLDDQQLYTFKRYDLDDKLIQTGSYKDSKLTIPHGKFVFYEDVEQFNIDHHVHFKLRDKTRFTSQEGTYVDGFEEGAWYLYYPDGNILSKQHFKHGKFHGEFVSYDKFGKIMVKGNYVEGLKEGQWIMDKGRKMVVFDQDVQVSSTRIKK